MISAFMVKIEPQSHRGHRARKTQRRIIVILTTIPLGVVVSVLSVTLWFVLKLAGVPSGSRRRRRFGRGGDRAFRRERRPSVGPGPGRGRRRRRWCRRRGRGGRGG